jgi:hypothetical protein
MFLNEIHILIITLAMNAFLNQIYNQVFKDKLFLIILSCLNINISS